MDEQPQGGLLNFFKSPGGQGLLSAVAGYAAGARRGTPVNNIGKGLLAGVAGYQGANEDLRKQQEEQRKLAQQQKLQEVLGNPKSTFADLAGAGAPAEILKIYQDRAAGPKVHSVVQGVGPNGEMRHIPIDQSGNQIGEGYAGYVNQSKPTYLKTDKGYMSVGDDGVPTPVVGTGGGVLLPPGAGGGAQKPMPVTALRMIEDNKQAIFTAENINGMMQETLGQLESGSLKFGPLSNWSNKALNWAGQSTPESQQYANAQANFEKMRNDSLRLNKGTQTEGDAQRAWKELFENMNDEKIVADRLRKIIDYNTRAVEERQGMLDEIYTNYGREGAPQPQQPAQQQAAPQQRPAIRQSPGQQAHPMTQQAKQAIAAGRDPEAVMQMLKQNGIDPSGLIGDSMQGAFGGVFQ